MALTQIASIFSDLLLTSAGPRLTRTSSVTIYTVDLEHAVPFVEVDSFMLYWLVRLGDTPFISDKEVRDVMDALHTSVKILADTLHVHIVDLGMVDSNRLYWDVMKNEESVG